MNRNALDLKGESFEIHLALKLKSKFPKAVILHNVWADACSIDASTQIDLIFISDKSFIFLEAKNWSKLIQGNYNDSFWLMGSGRTNKPDTYSPLRQNMTHIRSLRNCMRMRGIEPVYGHNIVVVPDSTEIKSNCKEVIHECALIDTIKAIEENSPFTIDKNEYRSIILEISEYNRR